ncbi:type II toxin-antitoxin system mRNA interferase toxin, RelE/StbE family [Candidatus Microgenomates bacterium]|nr:type II toxin-antitoxin system mRNA interferase toxin, RelE/StbE family [Candidatus Microgenomates bacterium]
MKINYHRHFDKRYLNLSAKQKAKCKERLALFFQDEFCPILGNHPLKGKYQGYRSINIGGDLRAIYKKTATDAVVFVAVDTHSKLYK